MARVIEAYFDFRSPFAYIAHHRVSRGDIRTPGAIWRWRPVSIDVLLNLQAGREPWAPYADPLAPPKRTHLIADVRRCSAYYDVPLRPPRPARPNPVPALWLALQLPEPVQQRFRTTVFQALWQDQDDVADAAVLARCLDVSGCDPQWASKALSEDARREIATATQQAYAAGVFGVPTFTTNGEVFFGNDRLDILAWHWRQLPSAADQNRECR